MEGADGVEVKYWKNTGVEWKFKACGGALAQDRAKLRRSGAGCTSVVANVREPAWDEWHGYSS